MLEFMDYVQAAFHAQSRWNRDNSYASLTTTAHHLLDFPIPQGIRLHLASLSSSNFASSYTLGNQGVVDGSLSFLYTSLGLRIPSRSSTVHLGNLVQGYRQLTALQQPVVSRPSGPVRDVKEVERKNALLYGRLYLPTSTLEALYLRRISPARLLRIACVSDSALPNGGSILAVLQNDFGKYSTEYLYSTDSALLGMRGLYNFGYDPRFPDLYASGRSPSHPWDHQGGRLSAGAEAYFSPLNKSGGISTGLRFTTLPIHTGFPYTMTLTLNPLMGNLSSTYTVKAGPNLAFCSRFDFNVYSYESDVKIGMELWSRQQPSADVAWATTLLRPDWKRAEPDANGVLKATVDNHGKVGLLWECRVKELLVSLGAGFDLQKRQRMLGNVGVEAPRHVFANAERGICEPAFMRLGGYEVRVAGGPFMVNMPHPPTGKHDTGTSGNTHVSHAVKPVKPLARCPVVVMNPESSVMRLDDRRSIVRGMSRSSTATEVEQRNKKSRLSTALHFACQGAPNTDSIITIEMACEVASSPFSEHTLDDSWMKTTESGHSFDALMEFNATFGGNNSHSTIDPQMLSNPPSPANSFTSDFNLSGLEPTHHGLEIYPLDFASIPGPYYSIEQQQQHPGSPSLPTSNSVRHPFRRSVSEPPGGLPLHQQHHAQHFGQPMTFNRNGHFIGNIQSPQLQRLKSLPKAKPARSQPYRTKTNGQQQQQQQRYQLRRSQTQPMHQHAAPTSTPTMMAPPSSHPYPAAFAPRMSPGGHMGGQPVFEPLPSVPEQRSCISSRVCTPTPEDVFGGSPQQHQIIDPMLTAPPTPGGRGGAGVDSEVTVAMSVDQLKELITEAVQKAVMGMGPINGGAGPATEGTGSVEGAEAAVMSIEGDQASGGWPAAEQMEGGDGGLAANEEEHPTPRDSKHDELDGLFVV
ncbi:Mitochondrial distribution and morphology protein 10 [Friedmanniomyces endolithicus]|nr:Mitochondrial distribution and morphology protein 10 [Friedmanniomyces endolithicus]KAK0772131.1 Mitochondrial distribution and morphology protein 10 [Friedmanniomyces endolithicus]KAK0789884.1 Mitochondrial distribution and morphology protein 10 [Friedmanniomyces endolithicus]